MAKIDKEKVWEKGKIIEGKNPELFRSDQYGNQIYKPSYGKKTEQGWEIDHSKPTSKGGTDHLNNLNPTQWRINRQKSDKYPFKND
jgi:5-methylcytosine-specific restriction endonuclease McrA